MFFALMWPWCCSWCLQLIICIQFCGYGSVSEMCICLLFICPGSAILPYVCVNKHTNTYTSHTREAPGICCFFEPLEWCAVQHTLCRGTRCYQLRVSTQKNAAIEGTGGVLPREEILAIISFNGRYLFFITEQEQTNYIDGRAEAELHFNIHIVQASSKSS